MNAINCLENIDDGSKLVVNPVAGCNSMAVTIRIRVLPNCYSRKQHKPCIFKPQLHIGPSPLRHIQRHVDQWSRISELSPANHLMGGPGRAASWPAGPQAPTGRTERSAGCGPPPHRPGGRRNAPPPDAPRRRSRLWTKGIPHSSAKVDSARVAAIRFFSLLVEIHIVCTQMACVNAIRRLQHACGNLRTRSAGLRTERYVVPGELAGLSCLALWQGVSLGWCASAANLPARAIILKSATSACGLEWWNAQLSWYQPGTGGGNASGSLEHSYHLMREEEHLRVQGGDTRTPWLGMRVRSLHQQRSGVNDCIEFCCSGK